MTRGRASDDQLAAFSLGSQPGNERLAMQRVADAVRALGLDESRVERLKTAVAEATLNAMEHGNHFQPDRQVLVTVAVRRPDLIVTITDGGGPMPATANVTPDLDSKLAGRQPPRGWGLYLIRRMVDEMTDECTGDQHTVHLRLRLT